MAMPKAGLQTVAAYERVAEAFAYQANGQLFSTRIACRVFLAVRLFG
ncbi:MAG: hypothetical protein M3O94_01175 [Actinomycetota bacterium]|nr:hypothetical protein [Actinomycetota bacterium]